MNTKTAFWQGALASLFATGVGYLVHRLSGWLFWPEIAAQWSFALFPGWLQVPLISSLGADAKILGLYVAMLFQILAGGVIVWIAPQARWPGKSLSVMALVCGTAFAFKGIAFAVQLPDWMPFIAGTLLAGLGFAWSEQLLQKLWRGSGQNLVEPVSRWTRREAFLALGTVLGSALLWPWVRSDLNQVQKETVLALKPVSENLVATLRQGSVDFDQIPLISPWLTPEPQFYYVSKNLVPHTINLQDWQALRVEGLVENPLRLTLEDLQALPQVEFFNTLQCIDFDPYSPLTADLIGNGLWTGVPLRVFLERTRVKPEAVDLVLEASDGYSDSLPLRTILEREDIMLAWALNEKPLSAKHGHPLRLIVPGQYGMKNVKHVQRLKAVNKDYKGYWQQRGWVDDAPVNSYANVESVQLDQAFPAGKPIIVAGWAFAGLRGITKVEVSVDNGKTWTTAQVEPQRSSSTWVRWAYLWEFPAPGRQAILSRAFDETGQPQIEKRTGAFPSGATGYHRVWIDIIEA